MGVGLPLAAGVVGGHGRVEGGARLLQLGVELAQLTGGALGPLLVGAGRVAGGAELADHVLLLVGRDLEVHGRPVHGCGGNHPAPDVCAHGPVPQPAARLGQRSRGGRLAQLGVDHAGFRGVHAVGELGDLHHEGGPLHVGIGSSGAGGVGRGAGHAGEGGGQGHGGGGQGGQARAGASRQSCGQHR